MSECSTLATSIGRSCPIHPSVIQPDQFRCDLARAEAAEAEVERLTADFNAAVERIHELLAEKVDREAAIQRVRELHAPVEGWGRGVRWCIAACDGDPTDWPCTTIRALDGGES